MFAALKQDRFDIQPSSSQSVNLLMDHAYRQQACLLSRSAHCSFAGCTTDLLQVQTWPVLPLPKHALTRNQRHVHSNLDYLIIRFYIGGQSETGESWLLLATLAISPTNYGTSFALLRLRQKPKESRWRYCCSAMLAHEHRFLLLSEPPQGRL